MIMLSTLLYPVVMLYSHSVFCFRTFDRLI